MLYNQATSGSELQLQFDAFACLLLFRLEMSYLKHDAATNWCLL
jgi:hypothetical protein